MTQRPRPSLETAGLQCSLAPGELLLWWQQKKQEEMLSRAGCSLFVNRTADSDCNREQQHSANAKKSGHSQRRAGQSRWTI
jgi:hypothetical protein